MGADQNQNVVASTKEVFADSNFVDPFAEKKGLDEAQVSGEQRAVDGAVARRVVVQEVELVLDHLLRAHAETFLFSKAHVAEEVRPEVEVLGALRQDGVADTSGLARRHPERHRGLEDRLREKLLR